MTRNILGLEDADLLVLNTMFPAIGKHLRIPAIPLEPSVLDDLYTASAMLLQSFQHLNLICVADADVLDLARVLQRYEHLPRSERTCQRIKGRVEDVAVDVRRPEVLQRVIEGVADLGLQLRVGVVRYRLRQVLSAW